MLLFFSTLKSNKFHNNNWIHRNLGHSKLIMFQFLKSSSIFPAIFIVFLWILGAIIHTQLNLPPYPWEFKYHLIGQSLNQEYRLYEDIKDDIGPLSANFHQLLDYLNIPIGYNPYITTLIILIQGFIFQQTIKKFDLISNLGHLPFFVYTLFFHLSLEFLVPNGAILGLTFILLAWKEIMAQESKLQVNDRVFMVGIFIGVASLFFLSYSFFIFWAILSLLFFSSITIRQIILLLIGYIMILIVAGILFSFNGNLFDFLDVFKRSALEFRSPDWAELKIISVTYIPVILLGTWGLWKIIRSNKIGSNGQKAQQTNVIYLFFSFVAIFTIPTIQKSNFVFLLPSLAYLTLNFYIVLKKYWQKEFFTLMLWILLVANINFEWGNRSTNQRIIPSSLHLSNQKIMVLGPQLEEYQKNVMVGPFVNWQLSKSTFMELDQYKTEIMLNEYFSKEVPTYIYDPEKNLPKIARYLPQWTQRYREISKNLYQLKP